MSRNYPLAPGSSNTDTSRAAAEDIESKAAVLRVQCMRLVRAAAQHDAGVLLPGVKPDPKKIPGRNSAGVPVGLTAREAADMLDEHPDNIQPRMSELRALGQIRDSGVRRENAHSGKLAIAWTPGDDPDKPQPRRDNSVPAKPAAKAAYARGLAASFYTVEASSSLAEALAALKRRLRELEPGSEEWK